MDAEPLRWAIFTSSVLSTVDNPEAHLWRAIGGELNRRGHEATFFEERGNPALTALLQQVGSVALLEFRERFPDIQYRTLDPRSGYELADWLTRTLATVDIAVTQPGAPAELVDILDNFTRPYLQTFLVDSGWGQQRPPVRQQDESQLAGLTGVLVANEEFAEMYGQTVPAGRIYRFGPLPERAVEDDEARDSAGILDDAARQIIDTITTVSLRIRRARGAQMLPNGRSDEADRTTPFEPN